MEPDVSCGICGGEGCRTCRYSGWIEMGGSGMVDPRVFENVGVDPEEWTGFAFGCGIERVAQLKYDFPDIRAALGGGPPGPDAVLRVPVSWLREYVPLEMPLAELAERLSISTAEVEGIERRGVPDEDGNLGLFRVGRVARGGQAPERRPAPALPRRRGRGRAAADRLRRLELRRRRDGGGRAAGRGASRRAAARAAQGARRALRRDDPRRGRGRARHRPLRDHGPPGDRAGNAARRRAAARRGGAARRVDRQPARPALGLRPRPRGRRALRPRACAMARGQTPSQVPTSRWTSTVEDFEGCPRYIGRLFRDVSIGPSPLWLQVAAAERRHAPDLERRRRDQLRDARARQPAARLRPDHARGRKDRRPPRAAGREDPHARRRRPQPRADRPDDRRRRALGRARRDHGRRGDGDRRVDDRGPARGGQLRADGDLPHLRAAAAAHGGLEPLGEGRRPVPCRAGGEARDAADRRDCRRALGRPRRRERRAAGAAGDPLPARARRRADRRSDDSGRAARLARAARLRASRRGGRDADLARPRRHARGRRDRGGRALPARGGAVHAARAPRDVRRADAAAAPPPPRRGRACRASA